MGICILIWLGYADDLVIPAKSAEDLNAMLNELNEIFGEYCLKMNQEKTETLILNWKLGKGDNNEYPKSIVNIKGTAIKNSRDFK